MAGAYSNTHEGKSNGDDKKKKPMYMTKDGKKFASREAYMKHKKATESERKKSMIGAGKAKAKRDQFKIDQAARQTR